MNKNAIYNNKTYINIDIAFTYDQLQAVALRHFENLANDIGDNLFNLETLYNNFGALTAIGPFNSNDFDILAEEIDAMLTSAKIRLNQDLYKAVIKFTTNI